MRVVFCPKNVTIVKCDKNKMQNIKSHSLIILATILVAGSFLVSERLSGLMNPIALTFVTTQYLYVVLDNFKNTIYCVFVVLDCVKNSDI
jgi:hypothetical protein